MFLKISRYFKHSTPLARPTPSNACTRSRWQHYLLELNLFLFPETTHKEPGIGNSYWVLKVFPGYVWDQTGMKQQLENASRDQKESFLRNMNYCSSFVIKNITSKEQWLAFWHKTPSGKKAFLGVEKGEKGEEEASMAKVYFYWRIWHHPLNAPIYTSASSESPTGLLHASTLAGSSLAHLWN